MRLLRRTLVAKSVVMIEVDGVTVAAAGIVADVAVIVIAIGAAMDERCVLRVGLLRGLRIMA
ncbi:hypothetical protein GCM10011507_32540 [Edaphobacter acidisoli]|uniref:Uncharacterized protein n=1 Tax=Edaphobacter acidisoli TaxID=2040573 RepID=A0A916W9K9_9BACT|nr:hypothetical protein GCM10011507_32540 [Edaphobacter acidisoli]